MFICVNVAHYNHWKVLFKGVRISFDGFVMIDRYNILVKYIAAIERVMCGKGAFGWLAVIMSNPIWFLMT